MERYTMFLDWKNQYCENDYTTQSNLSVYIAVKKKLQKHWPPSNKYIRKYNIKPVSQNYLDLYE